MIQSPRCSSKAARSGFTLIEIILVVTIIMLLVGLVGPRLAGVLPRQKIRLTRLEINTVKSSLVGYESHMGTFPTTDQGLLALVKRPVGAPESEWVRMMDKVPLDAWGHAFQYACPGTDEDRDFDLVSAGGDGKFGTADDITNFEPPTPKTGQ